MCPVSYNKTSSSDSTTTTRGSSRYLDSQSVVTSRSGWAYSNSRGSSSWGTAPVFEPVFEPVFVPGAFVSVTVIPSIAASSTIVSGLMRPSGRPNGGHLGGNVRQAGQRCVEPVVADDFVLHLIG